MKKLLVIMITLTLNSCMFEENGIEMNIKNSSNRPITNVKFTTSENLDVVMVNKIEPNESVTKFLSMQDNKFDGAYSLSFTRANGKKEMTDGGYYTNGVPLDQWVKFEVKPDTIFAKFSGIDF